MDPCTGWPFFVDHGTRRTTWEDPRYSERHESRPGLTLGQGFNDSGYPGGVFTPARYPEMYNNPLHRPNKHLDLNDNVYPGYLHPRSAGQISKQKNVVNTAKVAMEKDSPITHTVQMDYNTTSSGQLESLTKNSNVVIHPEITLRQNNGTLQGAIGYKMIDAQGLTHVHNPTIAPVVNKPENVSAVAGTLPAANVENFSQPDFSNTDIKSNPEILRINEVIQKSLDLEQKVLSFKGGRGTKEYFIIEELLVSLLLLLDKIETHGDADIRKARKSAVCHVQQLLSNLEEKAKQY